MNNQQVQQNNQQVQQQVNTVVDYSTFNGIMNNFLKMQDQQSIMAPANYSISNAIKTAYLELQGVEDRNGKPALSVCTPESINQALLEMVIKGLNPAKKQCYFIVYGNKLSLSVSYQGVITQMKRIAGIKDVKAYPVYACDEFDVEFDILTGTQKLATYKPNIKERTKSQLIGAFAVVINDEGKLDQTEYMTMEQINAAWAMGAAKGNSKAHRNFSDEMAMKTVVNRLSKRYLNNSDDYELFEDMRSESEFQTELSSNANNEALEFDECNEVQAQIQEVEEVEHIQQEDVEIVEPQEWPDPSEEIPNEDEQLEGQMSIDTDKAPF